MKSPDIGHTRDTSNASPSVSVSEFEWSWSGPGGGPGGQEQPEQGALGAVAVLHARGAPGHVDQQPKCVGADEQLQPARRRLGVGRRHVGRGRRHPDRHLGGQPAGRDLDCVIYSNACDITDAAYALAAEGHPVDTDDLATVSPYITHTIRRCGNWTLNLTPPG